MPLRLPAHLIHSIFLLSAAFAETEGTSTASSSASHLSGSFSEIVIGPSVIPSGSITLWDVGFSLRKDWADLRDEEACPVSPNLMTVEPDAPDGDQKLFEAVVSTLHPSDEATVSALLGNPAKEAVEGRPSNNAEESFVSFEEWKKIKLVEEGDDEDSAPSIISSEGHSVGDEGTTVKGSDRTGKDKAGESLVADHYSSKHKSSDRCVPDATDSVLPNEWSQSILITEDSTSAKSTKSASVSPGPQRNRYNYASPDCSARIHSSSPQTQHASSLLHKSRDRYMLTPCKTDEHWVIIELCDEIRVEALDVAAWEFFSGVVRDVRISVGGAEDDGDEEEEMVQGPVKGRGSKWKEVGAFVGKNVRGTQVNLTYPQVPMNPAQGLPSDLCLVRTNVLPSLSPPGLPLLLRYRILLPRLPSQGLWDEPDGGLQVGTEAAHSDSAGEREGEGDFERS